MSHIMRIRVNGRLSVVYGALEKAENEGVEILDCVKEQESITPDVKKHHMYVNGVKNKGIKGSDLVIKTIKLYGGATIDDLTKAFVKEGFAIGSASASTSKLVQAGEIGRDENGKYRLAK